MVALSLFPVTVALEFATTPTPYCIWPGGAVAMIVLLRTVTEELLKLTFTPPAPPPEPVPDAVMVLLETVAPVTLYAEMPVTPKPAAPAMLTFSPVTVLLLASITAELLPEGVEEMVAAGVVSLAVRPSGARTVSVPALPAVLVVEAAASANSNVEPVCAKG